MHNKGRFPNVFFNARLRPDSAALAIMVLLLFLIFLFLFLTLTAQAQTFKLLHTFTGGSDGADPFAALTMDEAGNLYGTTRWGGNSGAGTAFRLTQKGSGWVLTSLHSFSGGSDGTEPLVGVVFGPDGRLYGTTHTGGGVGCFLYRGCGTVFSLTPPTAACKSTACPWVETVLYRFAGTPDGQEPSSSVIFDASGAMYLTTRYGGQYDLGAVIKLTPSIGWTESVLHDFRYGVDNGTLPFGGVILDPAGNLYGTTQQGGYLPYAGTVYRLSPSGQGWDQEILYSFKCNQSGDGGFPVTGLIFDQLGNLYGTSSNCGGTGGAVYTMIPLDFGWSFAVLNSSIGGELTGVTMDAAGNLYGASCLGGSAGVGNVFRLTPSDGRWIYTSVHNFTGQDGECPQGGVMLDAGGNLYGTTVGGGPNNGQGTVWEITP